MFINAISIRREGYFNGGYGPSNGDPTKPFRTVIEVQGQHGKVELNLAPDLSARIMEIIAEEVAAAGRATAEAMTADVFSTTALAAPAAA